MGECGYGVTSTAVRRPYAPKQHVAKDRFCGISCPPARRLWELLQDTFGNPLRRWNTYSVSNHTPSRTVRSTSILINPRQSPTGRKPLQTFGVANCRFHNGTALNHPNRRRRRNPQSRAALKRRDGIVCPSQTSITFCPVKSVSARDTPYSRTTTLIQQNRWSIAAQ